MGWGRANDPHAEGVGAEFILVAPLAPGMESPYDVLLVDPDADDEEIERAYRRRVIETHPDHGGSTREFQRVRAAYEALASGEWDGDGDVGLDDVEAGDGADTPAEEPEWTEARVEYLNYDVLDDHGWDLDDPDLFERAAAADLDPADYGEFLAAPGESLLESAEDRGFTWPYSCRGGACANCAVSVAEGDLEMPLSHVLPEELLDRGVRLSCIGVPTTGTLQVVFNVKHLPEVEELLLPPGPFREAHLDG